jgi:hypothetical protein
MYIAAKDMKPTHDVLEANATMCRNIKLAKAIPRMRLAWLLLLLAHTHPTITRLEAIHNISKVDAKVDLCWHPAAADCALQRHQGIAVVARGAMEGGAIWYVSILYITAAAARAVLSCSVDTMHVWVQSEQAILLCSSNCARPVTGSGWDALHAYRCCRGVQAPKLLYVFPYVHLMTPNLKRGLSLPCPSMLVLPAAAATTRLRCTARR